MPTTCAIYFMEDVMHAAAMAHGPYRMTSRHIAHHKFGIEWILFSSSPLCTHKRATRWISQPRPIPLGFLLSCPGHLRELHICG
mmetsp:Transcript_2225/g.7046  ORF Transcript_2225/g.7046 Transcript_2225/m.7046 type:complete len:84 (+) Transcript_2225:283-534(+)